MAKKKNTKRKKQSGLRSAFARQRIIPIGIIFFSLILITYFFISPTYQNLKTNMWEQMIVLSVKNGFVVKNIHVTGREKVEKETLLALLNVQINDPILNFKPSEIQEFIKKLSWVEQVQVKRKFPDTIFIHLLERKPIALWQHNKKIVVVDKDGHVLTHDNIGAYYHLPLFIGAQAHQHISEILPLIRAEKNVLNEIEAITYISNRRWDLVLKNGAIVKLPEHDVGLALSQLSKLAETDQIFKKDLSIIDLRLEDQVILRPSAKANLQIERPEFDEKKTRHKKNI